VELLDVLRLSEYDQQGSHQLSIRTDLWHERDRMSSCRHALDEAFNTLGTLDSESTPTGQFKIDSHMVSIEDL
jgi:predicted RNase H-like nuclease (RuvC/YqgF family)